MTTNKSPNERIPTNLRLMMIVETLAQAARPLTATELNARLALPKASIHRLCRTLLAQGYLQRSHLPACYEATPRLISLAGGLLRSSAVTVARHQILKRLAARVHEAVNFVVPEPGGMRYLDRVDTDWPFRIQLPVGSRVPFHCTASGKTYLASVSRSRRRALINALDLRPMAANTVTDPGALDAQCEQIASRGYAVDREEFMDGLVALAVPVVDRRGQFLAAVAFHGPSQRVKVSQILEHLPLLKEGASRLCGLLDPGVGPGVSPSVSEHQPGA